MKIKIKLILIFFFAFYFFSLHKVSAVSAPTVDVYRLTFGFYREDWPAIYKDKILWVAEGIIYVYDVKEKTTSPFFEGTQPLINFYALIAYDGRYIIYTQYDGTSYNVSAYDTEKMKDIPITNGIGSRLATDYDNKTVVYIDGGACGELYAYDIVREEAKLVTENACGSAKISKGVVVWAYGSNIYGYDLRKDETFLITDNGGHPNIYKDNVIWLNLEEGFTKVHLKNLNTNESKILYQTSEYGITYPAISDRYVIWGKTTAQDVAGVEGIDLVTEEVFEIQEQGPHQNGVISPIIDDGVAAWMAWRTGNGDIYAALINKN